jgi:hypothetical protein
MSAFVFVTVVAALVAGGLFARSVVERDLPMSLRTLHAAD